MSAGHETELLRHALNNNGVPADWDDANTLRRAQITLQKWAKQACGNSNNFCSWSIERDEQTDVPYRCVYPHSGKSYRVRIADREAGALRRVAVICTRLGAHFYHQTDPRGCALYVSMKPLPANDYTRGVACIA